MRNGRVALAVLLLAGCSGAGSNTDANAQTATRRSVPLEVAGIRPGMTVDEAFAILKGKGFDIDPVPLRSYENAIANAVASAKGQPGTVPPDYRGVSRFEAKKGGETVSSMMVAPGPKNGTIINVLYRTSNAGLSATAFKAEVIKRYGPPTQRDSDRHMSWCATGDTCTNRNRLPMLVYDGESSSITILSLRGGIALEDRERDRFAAEVAQRTGRAGSSF